MKTQPYLLGSGMASRAAKEAFAILAVIRPELGIQPALQLRRGERLTPAPGIFSVLCISTPHALHAPAIIEGDQAGFSLILAEKPAAVTLEQAADLAAVQVPVAICHGYRQLWGVQTLREWVARGDLGQIIAIEGRYWQSSAAQRIAGQIPGGGWKNDPVLSGPGDALLDVGVHWVDAALFVLGSAPVETGLWLSRLNGEAPHRDTHLQLQMRCENGARLFASISKTVHGTSNHFELNVIGTKGAATWKFHEPDQLVLGEGSGLKILARPRGSPGMIHPPFHGLGWLEGYVGILDAALGKVTGQSPGVASYPTLQEHLVALKALLGAQK